MSTAHVMHSLADGVPITLLCDLASTADPDSTAINVVERPASDSIWLEAATTLRQRWNAASA
ncbi:MAG TPA: hypothetical protein VHV79_11760 [Mycobacteriales bacterium]|jgi:hypothetical protein|nr:hypothetical protein [Mycobacteriales bacterium]